MPRTCATMDVHYRLLRTNPQYAANRARIESRVSAALRSGRSALRAGVTVLPVVVHVVYNTDEQNISAAQIRSQIDVLNRDFRKLNPDVATVPAVFASLAADVRVEFRLAAIDPWGSPTTGITRTSTTKTEFDIDDTVKFASSGGADAWPADRYLNLWVCPLKGGFLGYSTWPGAPAANDGVVITFWGFGTTGTAAAPYDLGRTATHEIGHWLNIGHIWGDDEGGDACAGTDNIDDTPNQAGPNFGVPQFPHVSCDNGPNGDLFMDYMDYVDDAAMVMFTKDQADRMQATLDQVRSSIGGRLGGAEVILFEHTSCRGAHRHVYDAEESLSTGGPSMNEKVSSIVVVSGNWVFYRDSGFRNAYPVVLGPGTYPSVAALEIGDDTISSLQPTHAPANVTGGSVDSHLVLFQHGNLHGAHKHVFGTEPDLNASDDSAFNDEVSSIAVLSGCWRFFRDSNCVGPYPAVLGPGLYTSVEEVGIQNDDMSSLTPTTDAQTVSGKAVGGHVVLFESLRLRGAHKHVFTEETTLNASDDSAFENVVSSIAILATRWDFFQDSGFQNAYPGPLSPGLYPRVADFGITNDTLSSLRPVANTCLARAFGEDTRGRASLTEGDLATLRQIRDVDLATDAGRAYVKLFEDLAPEVLAIAARTPSLRDRAVHVLAELAPLLHDRHERESRRLPKTVLDDVEALLAELEPAASDRLQRAVRAIRADLPAFRRTGVKSAIRKLQGPDHLVQPHAPQDHAPRHAEPEPAICES